MSSKSYTKWMKDILLLSGFILAFYLFWIGSYPLFTPDEGRYSEVAREMVMTHDYITPRVNGVAFLDKPILYYWLQATAIKLFGVNEWALRLFPALLGVFGCVVTYACGRKLFNRRTGLLAAIILATAPLYFGGAHYADLNLEVAVWISCSLLCFITALQFSEYKRTLLLLCAYLFAALAFLTKGLIGIIFPAMIIGTWIIILSHWKLLLNMRLISGLLLFAAIVTPWYVLAQRANPTFLHYFFVTQQFTRFVSAADFNNKQPFWFYIPVILVGFFPWTLFLIQSLIKALRNILQAREKHAVELFLILWVAMILVFFSLPKSKIVGYIFPVFPAIALLTGNYLDLLWQHAQKNMRIVFASCTTIAVVMLMVLMVNAGYLNKKSVKPLAINLKKTIQSEDLIATYYNYYQDLPIYLQKNVMIVSDWDNKNIASRDNWEREFWLGKELQDSSRILIDEKYFWQNFNGKQRMYVLMNAKKLKEFQAKAKEYFIINKINGVMLVSNQMPSTTLLSK